MKTRKQKIVAWALLSRGGTTIYVGRRESVEMEKRLEDTPGDRVVPLIEAPKARKKRQS